MEGGVEAHNVDWFTSKAGFDLLVHLTPTSRLSAVNYPPLADTHTHKYQIQGDSEITHLCDLLSKVYTFIF